MERWVKLVVPDLVSPSYFPAIAAVEMGCIERRGAHAELGLHYPVTSAVEALRDGEVAVVAGAAHALFHGTPDGGGVKLIAAISRYTYWFLVVRSDIGIEKGARLSKLHGLRIGAAPGPREALVQLLADSGADPAAVEIVPVPAAAGGGNSFGVAAAEALADGSIDGFWANGMGAEVAVRNGTGSVLVDGRRGDGHPSLRSYTFAALMTTMKQERDRPAELAAVVAGLVDAQQQLRADPGAATEVARRLFPPMESELISTLISRDASFYDPAIKPEAVADLVEFARRRGLASGPVDAEGLVSSRFRDLWTYQPVEETT
jgi:NitT/TauT family transport system substrate-binding protein